MRNKSLQIEIDAAYLYHRLAENETDEAVANVFREMSVIEHGHAASFAEKNNIPIAHLPGPSTRAIILDRIGKIFGYGYVLGVLMDTEKSLANALVTGKRKHNIPATGSETNHVKILRSILDNNTAVSGNTFARFESRHRSVGGNAIRAAVLGGNDGLVSNFSLVMGVAGAAAEQSSVLMAGLAGLLAGALSMALGEWISVTSSKELYENQMELEMEEIETNPEGEAKEAALIFMAKGIPSEQAKQMAAELLSDKQRAHELLVKEELGINAEELKGSAWEAALYSFILFAIGASIPVLPFMFAKGNNALVWSVAASTVGLFVIGAAITLFTNRNVWFSGLRQVGFGLAAAAVTFGIGKLIGVTVLG